MRRIIKRKGPNPEKYNDNELAITRFSYDMNVLQDGGQNNDLLRLFPQFIQTTDASPSKEWVAPWQMFLSGQSSPETTQAMQAWIEMVAAYYKGDTAAWDAGQKICKTLQQPIRRPIK